MAPGQEVSGRWREAVDLEAGAGEDNRVDGQGCHCCTHQYGDLEEDPQEFPPWMQDRLGEARQRQKGVE